MPLRGMPGTRCTGQAAMKELPSYMFLGQRMLRIEKSEVFARSLEEVMCSAKPLAGPALDPSAICDSRKEVPSTCVAGWFNAATFD